jgi:hypothetical protein
MVSGIMIEQKAKQSEAIHAKEFSVGPNPGNEP